jgi:hypothetical protein
MFSLIPPRFRFFICFDFDVESFLTFNGEQRRFFFDNFCSSLVLEDAFEDSVGCTLDEDNMLLGVEGKCLVTTTMSALI